jgi:hypothetical protein
MEKGSCRADDVEPPSGPVTGLVSNFLPEFADGNESLHLGTLKVKNFDSCVVDDLFVIVHKVEEAAHFLRIIHPLRPDGLC